jgi:hypothetical protein
MASGTPGTIGRLNSFQLLMGLPPVARLCVGQAAGLRGHAGRRSHPFEGLHLRVHQMRRGFSQTGDNLSQAHGQFQSL